MSARGRGGIKKKHVEMSSITDSVGNSSDGVSERRELHTGEEHQIGHGGACVSLALGFSEGRVELPICWPS